MNNKINNIINQVDVVLHTLFANQKQMTTVAYKI